MNNQSVYLHVYLVPHRLQFTLDNVRNNVRSSHKVHRKLALSSRFVQRTTNLIGGTIASMSTVVD